MPSRCVGILLWLSCLGCGVDEVSSSRLCEQLDACVCDDEVCPGSALRITDPVVVAPSTALPSEAVSQTAHNNLDIVWHDERLFFAYRTAPSHFASAETRIHVVSSRDQSSWRFEGSFHEGSDLREPRFLSIGGRLFLFYARLGTNSLAFEPGVSRRSEYLEPGRWTAPEDVFEAGFIPWRIHLEDDVAWLMGYTGGESIYSAEASALDVYWLRSDDGIEWTPAVPGRSIVLSGGVSEMDFAFLADGSVVLVGRNEAGDVGGFGSRICHGPAQQPSQWRCADDARKYDSPLVFRHGDQAYLIGRRNLGGDGRYDVQPEGSLVERRLANLAAYWTQPKRCALWKIHLDGPSVEHLLDLPTAGDTCFASMVPLGGNQLLVYDYSSPLTDPDIAWVTGQNGPTHIYRVTVAVP